MRACSIEPVWGSRTLRVTIPGRSLAVATIHPEDDGCFVLFPVEPGLLPDTSGMPLPFPSMEAVEAFLGMADEQEIAA